ncbi:heat shock factor 2-binding protein isoform X1 [Cygnus olor]|uniref:heat shock factor 2-binding protein isoform X1 n=1 Tax=Cygnus olor TaxID=8869 RepID=UPI001ADE491B|nr:heat shock factor 2-binding protein isoform X1 [Cygnus olor]
MRRRAGLEGDAQKAETKEDFVKVRRSDLERLTTEVMQLRDFLPKILNGDILWTFQKLDAVESSMEKKEEELEQLKMDCEHFRARLEAAQADCIREKKEKLDLRQHLHEAKQQLLQQAEYCTEMGAAVCTLLWGVSSNEEAVKTILGGSKAAKFFTITAQTMESFVKSLSEDMKQQDLDSDENQFVLALAGIVTNVAALACGREFLVTSSRELLDTMVHLLGDMKPGLCTKFKVLMLMSLYNVSINLKGLKYISESPGFIPLLWWLLNVKKNILVGYMRKVEFRDCMSVTFPIHRWEIAPGSFWSQPASTTWQLRITALQLFPTYVTQIQKFVCMFCGSSSP